MDRFLFPTSIIVIEAVGDCNAVVERLQEGSPGDRLLACGPLAKGVQK